ncbi:MAG: hypothetical protein ACK4Z8_02900 [Novosphingobium sp.]
MDQTDRGLTQGTEQAEFADDIARSDQLQRAVFEDYIARFLPETPDLSAMLLQTLFEHHSDLVAIERASTIPGMQRELAFQLFLVFKDLRPPSRPEFELLNAILRALVDPKSAWQLRLNYGRRGRPRSAFSDMNRLEREWLVLEALQDAVASGVKLESAISDATASFGVSRSKAFEIWEQHLSGSDPDDSFDKRLSRYEHQFSQIPVPAPPPQPKGRVRRFFDYITQEF